MTNTTPTDSNRTPIDSNTSPTDADDRKPTTDDSRAFPERTADLTAVVVERDLRPDECTIYPRGAADEDLVTKWITAEEGSYVALDEMR